MMQAFTRVSRHATLKYTGVRTLSLSAAQLSTNSYEVYHRERGISLELGQKIMNGTSKGSLVTVQRLRTKARELTAERKELIRLVTLAHNKRLRELAIDLSEQVKKKKNLIAELDTQAAQIFFHCNNNLRGIGREDPLLDLHGLCAHEALSVLHVKLTKLTRGELIVIVGKGPVLSEAVGDYCQLHGYVWRVDPDNKGAIQIEAKARQNSTYRSTEIAL